MTLICSGVCEIRLITNSSSYLRCEALEFADPVGQRGERGHHQEGAHHFLLDHHGDVSDALDGLSQPHLISQDPIDAILPQHLKSRDAPSIYTGVYYEPIEYHCNSQRIQPANQHMKDQAVVRLNSPSATQCPLSGTTSSLLR